MGGPKQGLFAAAVLPQHDATSSTWQFSVDVGGTFTDVVSRDPHNRLRTYKLLSSGAIRGVVEDGSTLSTIRDRRRIGDPSDFWLGYELRLSKRESSQSEHPVRVAAFDAERGVLVLDAPPATSLPFGCQYELCSHEPAPIVAIRYLMGLPLTESIGPIDVRLGTTRATNALLERKGARVGLVTTAGFRDLPAIGDQDRPALFDLHIRKRAELAECVLEVDERVSADGRVIRAPDPEVITGQLTELAASGVEAIAICLMHAYVNPAHERLIEQILRRIGFRQVSVSSALSRLERIVPRCDTTSADAYLSGVIRGYVESLRQCLPQARLWLMTSNGGLADADHISGKDTILSGPAGGVVGCALVAREAGFHRIIGFDMGGTSTDVCRIEARGSFPDNFEYTYETVKAGVRIMTPMLAIETVAAGGGSICVFDGQKLTVGPRSAGADPGPASYGRGGPLTLTDMDLFLGRLSPSHFPLPLDCEIVERRLAALADEVRRATGGPIDAIQLAEGFVRIADANMAAAIKKISVTKGYDVREYVLASFGGAGGQHACAVARLLGIRRVLLSPLAGVLSAVGISAADVKRIGQRSVRRLLDAGAESALAPVFTELFEELRRELFDGGAMEASLSAPVRTMDLAYAGQSTLITVPLEPFRDAGRTFERIHRQLYGYAHDLREIEVHTVRVELAAQSPRLSIPDAPQCDRPASPRSTEMVVAGRRQSACLHLRGELRRGMEPIVGPAIIIEDTGTVVVDQGWQAEVRDAGDIVLTDMRPPSAREWVADRVDPIQLELFTNQFAAIAEQMGATLRRTALSTNVKERLDFSCAIFDSSGGLVVNAPHIPVHLGGMSECVKALMEDVGRFEPGETYITNDPFRGGSHLNDVTVVTPVHDDRGERILFFVASRAHHAEIGGIRPGSMPPDSTCLADEGVLIRAFGYIRRGQVQEEQLRNLLTQAAFPSRTPDENLADVAAQTAANQTGVLNLKAMVDRYGIDVVRRYMDRIQAAAEEKMRAAMRKLPRGVHRFEDGLDDGSPIRLAVTIDNDQAVLDFSGTAPVLAGNLNANRAIVWSAVLYCFRCMIDEDVPLNAGVLAPIKIILPECLLNPRGHDDPRRCPAVAGGNVETSQRVVDCIFGALGTAAASQGTMNNLLMGNERFGYYETICGGAGAGPNFHGADAVHTHMTNTRLTDPEVLESRYPVRLIRFEIRRGSGGRGRFHGGCGVVREIEFLEPLEVSIISQRRTAVPYGLAGGGSGRAGRNLLRRAGAVEVEVLPPIAAVSVRAGDRLTIETPGGGGYGA